MNTTDKYNELCTISARNPNFYSNSADYDLGGSSYER